MGDTPLLLRSMLFVPGDSERKLARAQYVHADALILDLEDSVDATRKDRARELAAEFIGGRTSIRARTIWVRTNPAADPRFADDVAAAVHARADGIVLPKPRSAADVRDLANRLDELERNADRAVGTTKILPIATETPSSVLALGGYADCGPRLAGLTWGAEDLSEAVGATTAVDSRGGWLPPYELARSLTLFAAAAAGVMAIDTVHTDFTDLDGLRGSAAAAQRDGFAGKLAIHPEQIEILNRTFQPAADAVAAARAVAAAFAAAPGAGVVAHGGRMLDRPHLLRAQRVLAQAAAVDAPTDEDNLH
ncbi:MAG TPA: CoA ester lyase [Gammaproteobacteria bacterium]|nr:CoA ester lyase [Gammaproteobacteria bacterium]